MCVIPCPSVYAGTYLFNSKTNEIHDSINAALPAIAEMVKKFRNIEKTGMLYLYVRVTQKIREKLSVTQAPAEYLFVRSKTSVVDDGDDGDDDGGICSCLRSEAKSMERW